MKGSKIVKKTLLLALVLILALGVTGCKVKTDSKADTDLLTKAYTNMETVKTSKMKISLMIEAMGFAMPAVDFEVWTAPDESYMDIVMPAGAVGEGERIEILVQGQEVKVRSNLLDGMEKELQEELKASLTEQLSVTNQFEDMVLGAKELEFKIIDNPSDLKESKYKTYKVELDKEKILSILDSDARKDLLGDMSEEFQGLSPAEQANFEEEMNKMLESMGLDIIATIVVDTETALFKRLSMDVNMEIPFPTDDELEGMPATLGAKFAITADYMEINTDITFPKFN